MKKAVILIVAFHAAACMGGVAGDRDGSDDPDLDAVDTSDFDTEGEGGCLHDGDCDDGVDCTVDACTAGRCRHDADHSLCADDEYCDPVEGCVQSTPCETGEECDDGDPCTVDRCDEDAGVCRYDVLDGDDDGDPPESCDGTDCDDGDPDVFGGAPELCNGADDDCDDSRDEDFECARGDSEGCELCGVAGTRACTDVCAWTRCEPPPDSGLDCLPGDTRPCTTPCGATVTETCDEACRWPGCPAVETCNGEDDDCNGLVDDGFECAAGASEWCLASCGSEGVVTCGSTCTWGACVPPDEVCNGEDDDCVDGCDNGFGCCAGEAENCTTSEGAPGLRVCSEACAWGTCQGEGWAKAYGNTEGNTARSFALTGDGGYMVVGNRAWVLRLTGDGSIVWQRRYGDFGFYSIGQAAGGRFVLAGYRDNGDSGYDVWVVLIEGNGNVVWQEIFIGPEDEFGYHVEETADGGFVVGSSASSLADNAPIWVFKLAADGAVQWQKSYDGPGDDFVHKVHQTPDGGYILTGAYGHSYNASDAWILKLDANGDIVWQKKHGEPFYPAYDTADNILRLSDGSYMVAGQLDEYSWLAKLTSTGDIVWQRLYDGGWRDNPPAGIVQTADGGFVVGSSTGRFGAGWDDMWIFKVDAAGDVLWARSYGGDDYDMANAFGRSADGGLIMFGSTETWGAGGTDFLVLKLSMTGDISPSCPDGMIGDAVPVTEVRDTVVSETTTVTAAAVSMPVVATTIVPTSISATVEDVCAP